MLYPNVSFPVTTGTIATFLRTSLASWTSLIIAPKRPATMPKRFLSIRDDGGTQTGLHMVNRYGVNVWADSAVDAEKIARDAMADLRSLPGTGSFKSTGTYFGPIEVEDDPAYTFGTVTMSHFYFSFAAVLKGTQV
jgi:hypothetical protein